MGQTNYNCGNANCPTCGNNNNPNNNCPIDNCPTINCGNPNCPNINCGNVNQANNNNNNNSNANVRVNGLLFDSGSCVSAAAPPCNVVIKDKSVTINEVTRLNVEPLGMWGASFVDFVSALTETGLPMNARVTDDGTLIASQLSIRQELQAAGRVSGPDAAGVYTMQVNGDPSAPSILFRPLAGVRVSATGNVRIEANVPGDLTSPIIYQAFEVENY
jgi:hypothetical protein